MEKCDEKGRMKKKNRWQTDDAIILNIIIMMLWQSARCAAAPRAHHPYLV